MAGDPLLASLEGLLREGGAGEPREPEPHELRAAVAVLLVLVVRADAEERHDEHRALGRTLQRVLGLSPDESRAALRHGEDAVAGDVLFRDVVAVLRRASSDVRKKVVHSLWRVAYADAELEGREEYLVRKVAEHLELSTADLVETKLRAREELLEEGLH